MRWYSSSGSGTGSGFHSAACSSVKMAAFAPMPSASESTAVTVNALLARSARQE
jgi:hypothetical protein